MLDAKIYFSTTWSLSKALLILYLDNSKLEAQDLTLRKGGNNNTWAELYTNTCFFMPLLSLIFCKDYAVKASKPLSPFLWLGFPSLALLIFALVSDDILIPKLLPAFLRILYSGSNKSI